MTTNCKKEEGGSAIVARYTQEEKNLLFALFKDYEEVIDIKYRKSAKRKTMEVRQCWQAILNAYNNDKSITTRRNLKQLQKFWLNARLRKRYPSGSLSSRQSDEKKFITPLSGSSSSVRTLTASRTQSSLRPHNSGSSSDQHVKYEIEILNHNDDNDPSPSKPSRISIDAISNDNLSFEDLLEFKNSASHNPKIIAVKSIPNDCTQIQAESIEVNDDDLSAEATTVIYGQAASSEDYTDKYHIQEITTSTTQNRIGGNRAGGRDAAKSIETSTCYCQQNDPIVLQSNRKTEERINVFRLKEAELKYKQQQVRYEKERIELTKSQEELKYLREMHQMQLQEMQLKLKELANNADSTTNVAE